MKAIIAGEESAARRAVLLIAVLALWLVAFLPTWRDWLHLCLSDPQYEQGPILAVLGILIAGYRLFRLPDRALAPRPMDASVLVIGALAWVVAWLAGVSAPQQLLVVFSGLALVGATLGRSAAGAAVLPLALFLTASEGWEHAAVPLQRLTAAAVGAALPWFGVPVFVEANHVVVPAGEFVIEQGCAGVKYVMIMLAVAILSIAVRGLTVRARALLLVLAFALALVANWVRVGAVIYVGQVTHLQHPWVHDHYTLGWIIFGVFLVPFLIVTRHLVSRGRIARPPEQTGSGAGVPAAVASALPRSAATLLLIMLAWTMVGTRAPDPVTSAPPPVIADGAVRLLVRPGVSGERRTRDVDLWEYDGEDAPIRIAGATIRLPLRADGLAMVRAAILGPGKSVTVQESTGSVARTGKSVIRFAEQVVYRPDSGYRVIRWWFRVRTSTFDRSVRAKVALLSQLVVGGDHMAITMLEAACDVDCVSAKARLEGFMHRLDPQIYGAP